jgi:hypothetical protein
MYFIILCSYKKCLLSICFKQQQQQQQHQQTITLHFVTCYVQDQLYGLDGTFSLYN